VESLPLIIDDQSIIPASFVQFTAHKNSLYLFLKRTSIWCKYFKILRLTNPKILAISHFQSIKYPMKMSFGWY